MAAVKITDNVYWVGAIDWDIREFHGYETPQGTTYNAYLVLDDKISLIDTVKAPFADELIKNISEIIDPAKIDYLISNHAEPDHSGSLPVMADIAKNAVVIASPNDEKTLKMYYKRDFNFRVVKTGDSLNTGKHDFSFVLTPLLHWPDNMVTYDAYEKILFSNDAFGQHIASGERFSSELGKERILARAKDYYANIVLPFGTQAGRALKDTADLDIRLIAPSHGVMWDAFIPDITAKYGAWSKNETDEKLAVIVYDTMWGTTAELARRIAADFAARGIEAKVMKLGEDHVSACIDALMEAKYIAVGSPTLNRGVMHTVAAFLSYLKGLAPKNRTGLAFGSYGWSGESVGIIEKTLSELGYELLPQIKVQYKV